MPTKQKRKNTTNSIFLLLVTIPVLLLIIIIGVSSLTIKEQTTPLASLSTENEIIWNYFIFRHNNLETNHQSLDKLMTLFTNDAKFIDKTDDKSIKTGIPINRYLKYADSIKVYIEDFSILETEILTVTDSMITKRVKIKCNIKMADNKKNVNYLNFYFIKNKKTNANKIYKIESTIHEVKTTNLTKSRTYRLIFAIKNTNGQEISNKRPEIQSIINNLINNLHGSTKNQTVTIDNSDLEMFLLKNKDATIDYEKGEIIIRYTIQLSDMIVTVQARDFAPSQNVNLICSLSDDNMIHKNKKNITPYNENENTFYFHLIKGYTYVFTSSIEHFKTKDTTFTADKTIDNNKLSIELLPIKHTYEITFTGDKNFMNTNACPLPEKIIRTIPEIYFFDHQYDSLLTIRLNSEYWKIKGNKNAKVSISNKKYHIPVIRKSSKQKLEINIKKDKSLLRKKIHYSITDFNNTVKYKQFANSKEINVFFPVHPCPGDFFRLKFDKPLGFNITLDGEQRNKDASNDILVLNKTELSNINLTLTKLKPLNIFYIDLYGMSADEKRQALKKVQKQVIPKTNKNEIIYLFFVNNRQPETLSSVIGKSEKINHFFSSIFAIETPYTPYVIASSQINQFVQNAATKFPRNSLYFYYYVSKKITNTENYITSLKNDMSKYKKIIDLQ